MDTNMVYSHAATVFAAASALFLSIIGILGNTLTIMALLKYPRVRGHATTAFVISLSVSDLLFCSFSLPLTSVRFFMESWVFGETLCKMFPVIFYGNIGVSLFSMMGITINRFIYITFKRFYARIYERKYIIGQLIFIWTLPFLLFLPVILEFYGKTGLNKATFSCTIMKKDGKSLKKFLMFTGFLLPCLVIIISYTWIYATVFRQRKKLQRHKSFTDIDKNSYFSKNNSEESNRLTTMMAIIFGCFLICFLPSVLAKILDAEHQSAYSWFHIITAVMTWTSNVLNPFVYAVSNRSYRNAYYEALNLLKFWGEPLIYMPTQSSNSRDMSTFYQTVTGNERQDRDSVYDDIQTSLV